MIELGGSEIPAHSSKDFVLEVRPLAVGTAVTVRPVEPLDESWTGLLWTAWVNAENKVTVRLANIHPEPAIPSVRNFIAN